MNAIDDTPTNRTKVVKLALVPLLAIVLAVILFGQGDGDGASGELAEQPNSDYSVEAATDADWASGSAADRDKKTAFDEKRMSLSFGIEKVLHSNPFTLPAAFLAESRDAENTSLERSAKSDDTGAEQDDEEDANSEAAALMESLKQKTASIIVSGSKGRVAFIDSRALTVGDYLQEGVRIVEIKSDGVIVEIEPAR